MDDLLLSRVRLAVIAELVTAEWATFTDLQRSVKATNGKLVDGGYVTEQKRFVRRRPQTRYRLAEAGRAALLRHVAGLQALIESQA